MTSHHEFRKNASGKMVPQFSMVGVELGVESLEANNLILRLETNGSMGFFCENQIHHS